MQDARAVIYARYSSDKQRETSIDDQVRNCTRHAERDGFVVRCIYSDKAISGAVSARSEYQRMLGDAAAGSFDVVLVDDLSRLSRDDYEMKGVLRRLAWQGVRVVGVADGYDSARKGHKIHAGFKGLMNEFFLDDLRERTHRGMTGQALKGYNCGGRTFGYRNVPIYDPARKDPYGRPEITAVRYEIDEVQAAIVREIFAWYAEGRSCRWIANALNGQRIASPRGRAWSVGSVKVILDNEMYQGRRIWNRSATMKNPETGRRTYRARSREEWVVSETPELRIVASETIEDVRSRRERRTKRGPFRVSAAQRYLFSGLMTCAECSGSIVVTASGRYGCASYKTRGPSVCTNHVTVPREIVEQRILASVKAQLRAPGHFENFKRAAQRCLEARNADNRGDDLRRQLKAAERTRDNVLSAIKQGIVTPTTKAALEDAESEVSDLTKRIGDAERWNGSAILPRAIERYREAVDHLAERLQSHVEAARELLKSLLGESIRIRRNGDYLEAIIPNHVPTILSKALTCGVDSSRYGVPEFPESNGRNHAASLELMGLGSGECFAPTVVSLRPSQSDSSSRHRSRKSPSSKRARVQRVLVAPNGDPTP